LEVLLMSKKTIIIISVAIIIALLTSAWISMDGLAQSGDLKSSLLLMRRSLGVVVSVSEQQFTVARKDGQQFTLLVDEHTRFLDKDKNPLDIEDLNVDQWVIVAGKLNEEDQQVAKLVIILPDDFNPNEWMGVVGIIADIDAEDMTFSVCDKDGESTTFETTDKTRFRGKAKSFQDLEIGMRARVGAYIQNDGDRFAHTIWTTLPVSRYRGEITEINLTSNTFTLQEWRENQDMVFQVDEFTKFQGKADSLQSLQDIKVGMVAMVFAKSESTESEQLVARAVISVEKEQLKKYDLRRMGVVISNQHNELTIESPNGQEYHFEIVDDTRWMGRGVTLESLEDLEPGMRVIVAANEIADGKYQAQVVWALAARDKD
jgi:hypothetical protein